MGLSTHARRQLPKGPGGWEQGWDGDTGLSSPGPTPLWVLTGSTSLCRGESEAEMGRSFWAPGLPGGLLHIGAGCVIQEPKDAGPAQPLGLVVGCPWSCSGELAPESCQARRAPSFSQIWGQESVFLVDFKSEEAYI